MIVSRTWLEEWINLKNITTKDLCKTLNSIGLEVDSVRKYDVPKKIVFGKVLECQKHPDADKLNVCKVDIGTSIRQIVCGASNVREGLHVVVATIGAVMPNGMKIKPVKLRGVESEGMICSDSEIGLDKVNDGILELDESIGKFQLGEEVCNHPVFSDEIIEIELTANRGDCLSIRGVARDLGAYYNREIRESELVDDDSRVGIGRILHLAHEKTLDVSLKYKAIDLNDLKLPFILKLRLSWLDEKRENDIDAMMLYATHSTGVILRAYDHSFFCKDNENIAHVELKKDENSYAGIYAKEKASTVGIIQYDKSRFNKNKGIVLLEASYIPPDIISKKMQEHKIESGPFYYRTSRGSEPELDVGLECILKLLHNYSNSSVFGGTMELEQEHHDIVVSLDTAEITQIIGMEVERSKITKTLQRLGFDTSKSSSDTFVVVVPKYRHDIKNKQDIVEEIVRMVGIDNISSKPFDFFEQNRLGDDYLQYKKKTHFRKKLANSGFFESIHFVFDDKKLLSKYNFKTLDEELEILNPITNTLDTLRTTLHLWLLKSASNNAKNGYTSIRLFEIGSVFTPKRAEITKLGMIFSGDTEREKLSNSGKPKKVDFAYFTQKISDVIGDFELLPFETSHTLSHLYQCAKIMINGEKIGEVFKLHPNIQKEYDLEDTFMCEIDFDALPYELKLAKPSSKFQASFRDLSLLVPKDMEYKKIKDVIEDAHIEELMRFYPVDSYSDETIGKYTSLSIRFVLQSHNKTLSEEDITTSMDTILKALKENLGINLR